jgi:putative transposase
MAKDLDAEVAAVRNRPLEGGPYTYVSLAALSQKVRADAASSTWPWG